MSLSNSSDLPPIRITPYILALALIWSAITIASLLWNVNQIKRGSLDLALVQARESFKKDVLYRRWNAGHGGVYVPISETTPANPYLKVARRDIAIDDDLALTLINPAYMTRQVHEMAATQRGVKGHITSLDPIRPQNAPDAWETKALEAFASGSAEISSVETMDGIGYLRLMRPLMTEQSCLKCHAEQGYRLGDVRGGISVAVPISPFMAVARDHLVRAFIGHGALWVLGLVIVGIGLHRFNEQLTRHHKRSRDALIERETKYRGLFNDAVVAIYIFDARNRFRDANAAGLHLLGYTREELLRLTATDVDANPEDADVIHRHLLRGQKIENYEHRLRKKDGGMITVINNAIPIADGTGTVVGIQSTLVDISWRKQAEQQLRENQARLNALLDALPDLVWLKDPDGVYLACNSRFERFVGKDAQDIIGKDDFALMETERAKSYREHDRLALEKGGPNTNEEEVTFADDGHREVLEKIKSPVFTEDGILIGVLGIGRDITERKLKEKVQAAKLRLVEFSTTHSALELMQRFLDEAEALTDSAIGFYHFVEADQQTLSLQTWSTNTLENACTALGAGTHYAVSDAGVWVDCVRERGPVIHNDYAGLDQKKGLPEGHVPVVRELVVPVIRNKKIMAVLGVGNKPSDYTTGDVDIVQQFADLSWETIVYRRAVDAQRESEARYRSMMEAMNDAAYICSSDYRVAYLNPAMIRRIGRDATDEICHRAINRLDERCPWCPMETVQQGASSKVEVQSPMDGRFYQVSSSPIRHRDGTISKMTIYTDISQIKAAEERLRQAQKMESIGNLAGGIAHDFNNILSPIIGLAEMLMLDLPAGSFERENANDILKSAMRASDLVKQILSFSRQTEKQPIPVRIQQILKEVAKLMRSTIPANISIENSIDPACGRVLADPTQIHQIVMNLVTNAYHALEENGGSISLALSETTIDANGMTGVSLAPGRYAVVSVADTGVGIDPAIQANIFDPYFTTKKPGKGTGLGLSVVYGIVKDHGGDIRVESRPGEGATFNIYLPVVEQTKDIARSTSLDRLPTGNERILLVDDEEPVVRIEKRMLKRLGYVVTGHTHSLEALNAFKADPAAFDLVVTDMTMPKITGDQLAREILSIRPDLPIIICTGYSEKIDDEKAAAMGIKGLLMKPIVNTEMATMVRTVLDESRS